MGSFLVHIYEKTVLTSTNRLRRYLENVGFYKEREVSLPHKQSNLMRIGRDNFEGPAL